MQNTLLKDVFQKTFVCIKHIVYVLVAAAVMRRTNVATGARGCGAVLAGRAIIFKNILCPVEVEVVTSRSVGIITVV